MWVARQNACHNLAVTQENRSSGYLTRSDRNRLKKLCFSHNETVSMLLVSKTGFLNRMSSLCQYSFRFILCNFKET